MSAEQREAEEAMAHELAARGYRSMTSETWSKEGALDAMREVRRRNPDDPALAEMAELASLFADKLTTFTTVAPGDISAVLVLAGASVGALAVLNGFPAEAMVQLLQLTAVELDDRAQGGERS
ncbi:hypothetical protein [Streptomyces sp. NPDC094468]|uniref:hypothetical protein n=1 Tax=Streptomyces sp. NPDC094468 TaxID=3366066 RepID=UPI0038182586